MPQRIRHGFTLIELLVVIAIVGLLMGLLLPAVNMVREAARRMSCQNNLKQMGVALRSYDATWGVLPPSRIRWINGSTNKEVIHSWSPLILKYCEMQPIVDLYNVDKHWRDPANRTVVQTHVSLFVCPSTPTAARFDNYTGSATGDYGIVNEVKPDYYEGTGIPAPMLRAGAMTRWEPTRLQDITDGLSHTIIVAEDGGRPELYYGRQQVAGQTTKNGNGWADPDCNFSVSGILEDGFPGGPCVINCTNDSEIYSFHPGGSHFLFCDGSVRFVSDSVDGALLTAQVTRAGGETMIDVSSKD